MSEWGKEVSHLAGRKISRLSIIMIGWKSLPCFFLVPLSIEVSQYLSKTMSVCLKAPAACRRDLKKVSAKSSCVLRHPSGKIKCLSIDKCCAVVEISGVKALWRGQFMCEDLKQNSLWTWMQTVACFCKSRKDEHQFMLHNHGHVHLVSCFVICFSSLFLSASIVFCAPLQTSFWHLSRACSQALYHETLPFFPRKEVISDQ